MSNVIQFTALEPVHKVQNICNSKKSNKVHESFVCEHCKQIIHEEFGEVRINCEGYNFHEEHFSEYFEDQKDPEQSLA